MKKINKILLSGLLLGSAMVMTSCGEDYLETKPTESISDAAAVATVDNAYKALNGVAKTMTIQHGNYSQGFCGENAIMRLYENYPSQDYYYNAYAAGWADIHNQTMHTSVNSIYNNYAWYYYYQIITQANVIINRIDDAEGNDGDKKFIKASALTFRAYSYEKLIHYYCVRWKDSNNGAAEGLPLRLDESTGELAPSTMAQVYTQIYADLDEAITLFNESGVDRPASDCWTANLNVAHAVYARAALYKEDYQTALNHAKLAEVGYPLMSNDAYAAGFCRPTSEWIFGSYGSADENNWYWSYGTQYSCNGYYAANTENGAGTIGRELINRIPDEDFRKSLFLTESGLGIDANDANQVERPYGFIGVDYNAAGTGFVITDYDAYVKAATYVEEHAAPGLAMPYDAGIYHLGAHLKFYVFDTPGVGYLPFIRTSEMLLIEAECYYFLNNPAAAQEALVRLNAGSGRNPGYTCSKTGQDLFNEIADYRALELWGEGFQWSDFKRWKLPIVRHSWAEGGNAHPAVAVTIQPNEANNWTWDVPKAETDYNDGYTDINGPTAE